jgi:hypothetical protein
MGSVHHNEQLQRTNANPRPDRYSESNADRNSASIAHAIACADFNTSNANPNSTLSRHHHIDPELRKRLGFMDRSQYLLGWDTP